MGAQHCRMKTIEAFEFGLHFYIDNSDFYAKMVALKGREERIMSKRRHAIAMALCIVMMLSMFVSSAYIAHEAAHHHVCSGDNCPVCQFIAQVEQVRRGFGMILLALLL